MPRYAPRHVALARALSKLGVASRSEAVELIRAGRVRVNGTVVLDPAAGVIPERAAMEVDGAAARRTERHTIAFHKPRGTVTTRRDPGGRRTVFDVLGDVPGASRLKAVGRLDMATSGLLLFTTDSRLADWLTDPTNAVPRRYLVTARGAITDAQAESMQQGLPSRGERVAASRIEILKRSGRETHLLVELTEGKNREMRRLIEACGSEVTRLKRVAFGEIELGDLAPGDWRGVTAEEIRRTGYQEFSARNIRK